MLRRALLAVMTLALLAGFCSQRSWVCLGCVMCLGGLCIRGAGRGGGLPHAVAARVLTLKAVRGENCGGDKAAEVQPSDGQELYPQEVQFVIWELGEELHEVVWVRRDARSGDRCAEYIAAKDGDTAQGMGCFQAMKCTAAKSGHTCM